jgi:ATP-binding cassette subfamily B multidrug efflux pump
MPAMMLIMNGVSILIIWVGAHQVAASQMQVGSMMAFMQYAIQIVSAFLMLSFMFIILPRASVSADRIADVLDIVPAIQDPANPKAFKTPFKGVVEYRNVSFRYPGAEEDVLHNISFTAQPGQTTAFIGSTGSGKSTLVNLLPRFYDPSEGAVRLGGIDLRDLRMRDLRKLTGLVAQQGLLFDDSVLANIRYGSPWASEADVRGAAEKAYAHKFIVEKLDKGYQTVVGERGGRLSGGQRQRIILARAILRDPKFLILDEATSQIDLESEQLIHRVLEQFIRGRTTLLITHRMSSITLADRVVVMGGGRIIDTGTHDELNSRCELYARLCELGFQQAAA